MKDKGGNGKAKREAAEAAAAELAALGIGPDQLREAAAELRAEAAKIRELRDAVAQSRAQPDGDSPGQGQ